MLWDSATQLCQKAKREFEFSYQLRKQQRNWNMQSGNLLKYEVHVFLSKTHSVPRSVRNTETPDSTSRYQNQNRIQVVAWKISDGLNFLCSSPMI